MHKNRSAEDKKRQRKSSSDSEPSPAAKQTKMAGDSKNVDMQTILKAVQDMQAGQDSLKAFFDKRFQTMKADITKEFGTKMDSLKESFDLEIGTITARVESLESKLNEALNGEAINRPTEGLGRAIDQNLVIRNLAMPHDETNEMLLASLSEMFQEIGVHVNILEALRITPTRAPATAGGFARQGTPLVKVVLQTREDRNAVLSSKRQLSTKEQFKRVFIEPDRQRHERIMEANMRLLARKCPGLTFKRGRIIDSARNGPGGWLNNQPFDDNDPIA